MYKNKGNWEKASKEFLNNKNNAIAKVFTKQNKIEGNLSNVITILKDNYAFSDHVTKASSKFLEGFKPGYDATVVNKLKNAGANILAKVHMDELALGGIGTLSAYGVIKNPHDESRIVGGSSSGSVAAFSSNVGLSIGSDTGDSVRLPASYNGFVGFKPSYGAVSRYGLYSFASSLDTPGWITHNVNDSIEAARILFGRDGKDMVSKDVELPVQKLVKPKKVAMLNMYDVLSPKIKKQYNSLKEKLISDGVEVEVVEVDEKLLNLIGVVYEVISYSEVTSNLSNLNGISFGNRAGGSNWEEVMTNARSKWLGWMVKRRMTLGSLFLMKKNQEEIFDKAKKIRRLIVDAFNKTLEKHDVLIYPSSSIAPKLEGGKTDDWFASFLAAGIFSGNPSVSIPFGKEDDMPFGLSIENKLYEDKKNLSYALYFEKLIGGKYE